METLIDWAGRWQILAGALVAIAAVLVGVFVLRRNLGRPASSRLEEQAVSKARRLRALREAMPADLRAIIGYTEESAHISVKLLEGIRSQSIPWLREHIQRRELTYPILPDGVISNLEDLVDLLDEENARFVSELLNCFHIQHAQLADKVAVYNQPPQGGLTEVLTEHNVEYAIKNAVELHLRAASMFEFAQGQEDRIGAQVFTSDDVSRVLLDLGFADTISKEYEKELCRAFGRKLSHAPAG